MLTQNRRLVLAMAMLLPLGLSGCFRPLYAPDAAGNSFETTMAAVAVDPIEGRVGQQVRNALLFGLTGGGQAPAPRWTLTVKVASSRETALVDVRTDEPQIDAVTLTGDYSLKTPDGKIIDSGSVIARTTFDRTLQRFGALRAARDAENRAAELYAEQIKTRVAIRLSKG